MHAFLPVEATLRNRPSPPRTHRRSCCDDALGKAGGQGASGTWWRIDESIGVVVVAYPYRESNKSDGIASIVQMLLVRAVSLRLGIATLLTS